MFSILHLFFFTLGSFVDMASMPGVSKKVQSLLSQHKFLKLSDNGKMNFVSSNFFKVCTCVAFAKTRPIIHFLKIPNLSKLYYYIEIKYLRQKDQVHSIRPRISMQRRGHSRIHKRKKISETGRQ